MTTPSDFSARRDRALGAAVIVAALLSAAFYATRWAGDAEIHLVYAENAARGRWFEFNAGQVTQGSTSALWTLLLAALWRVGGVVGASWGASAVCLASFVAVIVVTHRLGRRVASPAVGLVAALLFAANPSIATNALLGMENCTAAALVGAGWLAVLGPWRGSTPWLWGALAGLGFLCRPDAAVPIAAQGLYALWRARRDGFSLSRWLGAGVVALAIVAPFYAFQHHVTGRWLPASGVSRVLLSRRTALHLGPLWIHLRLVTRLLVPYLPVSAGLAWLLLRRAARTPERVALGLATAATLFLHTFVVGAAHASRYFLVTFPAFFVLGVAGLDDALSLVRAKAPRAGNSLVALAAVWMALVYGADEYLRFTVLTRGATMTQHLGYYASRRAMTDEVLAEVGWRPPRPLQLAITEVQYRGFVDDRIVVRSLDGRVDQELLDVTGPDGCPDYAAYLRRVGADALHADQGCDCPRSLLCALERRAADRPRDPVTLDGMTFRYAGAKQYWRIERGAGAAQPSGGVAPDPAAREDTSP